MTTNNLEQYSKSNMLQEHNLNAHWSRTILNAHMLLLYASEAVSIQICSWSIFDLEFYSRLFMVLEHTHGSGPYGPGAYGPGA